MVTTSTGILKVMSLLLLKLMCECWVQIKVAAVVVGFDSRQGLINFISKQIRLEFACSFIVFYLVVRGFCVCSSHVLM